MDSGQPYSANPYAAIPQQPQQLPTGYYQPYGNQQPYYPYPMPPQGTNTLAILSFVFVFVFWPAAPILGVIALSQISRTRQSGRGLAIAGTVIGGIIYAFLALIIVIAVAP